MSNLNNRVCRKLIVVAMLLGLAGCGGGGGGGGGGTSTTTGGGNTTGGGGTTTSGYTISGYLVGLAPGQSVVLQNNGNDTLTVSANGAFTFSKALNAFSNYSVTVSTQPANGQACAVLSSQKNMGSAASTGSGMVGFTNVDTVRISCASVATIAGTGVYGWGDAAGEEATFYNPSGAAMDAAGNLYIADATSNVIRKISPAGMVSTLAGSGKYGYVDGPANVAQFRFPTAGSGVGTGMAGLAVDKAGNVYVGDTLNNVIRKITPAGTVSTFAGSGTPGYFDATGTAATFNSPEGVAVDSSGNIYVADWNNSVIRKITPSGVVTTLAGSGSPGYADGTGFAASFSWPQGVAVDSSGNVYVADTANHAIRKIAPTGVVTTLAGGTSYGWYDATGGAAQFMRPQSIAVDSAGNLYVADSDFFGIVRVISPAGVVSTLAGTGVFGDSDGPITTARLYYGMGIVVDVAGNVLVSDWSGRILKISAARYSYKVSGHLVGLASGSSLVLQNNGGDNLTLNANGFFTFATPLTDTSGSASYNVTILTQPAGQACTVLNGTGGFGTGDVLNINVSCAAVSTLAGSGSAGFTNGSGTAATFNLATVGSTYPTSDSTGVAVDTFGNIYVADTYNNVIRKITSAGVVSTFAGSGTAGFTNATGAAAQFNAPRGVAVDSAGNVYVGDSGNNAIRKITSTGVVTTLAGSATAGYLDATGSAAQFYQPRGVAVDAFGNVYVADSINNAIRVVTSAGVVTTLAGRGSMYWGYVNGVGTAAQFASPYSVAVDAAGNVYVADSGNYAVRKIAPSGMVTTLAGSPEGFQNLGHMDSTGTGATFHSPAGVAVDSAGNVYVADANNQAIRMISPAGVVTTWAGPAAQTTGTNTAGFVNGSASAALFNAPAGIAVDAAGNLYVADVNNNAIRKITP